MRGEVNGSLRRVAPADHPRVCGEKENSCRLFGVGEGSPPRVRGEVSYYQCEIAHEGITPACAGRRKPEYAAIIDD